MNRNKILFLDVDGVINTLSRSFDKEDRDAARKNCAKAVKQLNRIFDETDCAVVVSSSWRTIPEWQNGMVAPALEKEFKMSNLVCRYIGDTPDLNPALPEIPTSYENYAIYIERGVEITKWLNDNNYKGRYAIVDDVADEFDGLEDNLFTTKLHLGITKEIADAIIAHLNHENA